ncbi:MAG: response regulator, partial [Methanomassiliicoccales archaeon]
EILHTYGDGVPHGIMGDPTRLRQVLINLLNNAVKFTERGEVLTSITREERDGRWFLHFAVKDTGIGIPADKIGILFQPFTQADASTTRRFGGTGLGLAVSKRLVELMGGSIWIESEIGKGATFHFTILFEGADLPMPQHLKGLDPSLKDKVVMIVDDNPTNRQILTLQTTSWGMVPVNYDCAQAALEAAKDGHIYDVALVDFLMPEMDGASLALWLRDIPPLRHRPIILLSSAAEMATKKDRGLFDNIMTKPIKGAVLHSAILEALGVYHNTGQEEREVFDLPHRLTGTRILLAEDNVVNQKVALLMLERIGMRADLAANGKEVLEALQRQDYDIILMDVQMPEMDGEEATLAIRGKTPLGKQPYIIALTANARPGDKERLLHLGMDDYLAKPIRIHELVSALYTYAEGETHIPCAAVTDKESSDPSGLDTASLRRLSASIGTGGEAVILELLQDYVKDAENLLAELREAAARGDVERTRRAAHTLKSTSNQMGALRLGGMMREVETDTANHDLSRAISYTEKGEAELVLIRGQIEKGWQQ